MRGLVSLFVVSVFMAAACGSTRPKVTVLGVSQSQAAATSVRVFVEVLNPTDRELKLSRLRYQLTAESWFEAKGVVDVERAVGAGSAAVVEIAIPITAPHRGAAKSPVAFQLRGTLYAREHAGTRSWKVDTHGTLKPRDPQTAVTAQ